MSVLTKPDIIAGMTDGSIVVDPEPAYIGPNSIDLRLHHQLKIYSGLVQPTPSNPDWPVLMKPAHQRRVLDADEDNATFEISIPKEGYVLVPDVLYLGRTIERTSTPKHVPKIGGRSSTGRLGIEIHQTAGFGDVGFDGTWTLEITVVHPVRVHAGMRIAQLWLMEVTTQLPESERYRGRYQNQEEATPYRGHKENFPGGA